MADIILHKINEVWLKVECDKSALYDLGDRLSFYAPAYKFHPKFKMKIWDGKIKLLNINTRLMYLGLHKKLVDIAESLDYTVEYAPNFFNPSDIVYDKREIANCSFEPRNYQEDAIKFALEKKRCVLLSPTGSGKSYIIYLILKHIKKRTLIVVPTISLVHQMTSDFIKYDAKSTNWIHKIMAGADKNSKKPIVISTWQSLLDQDAEWFDQFDVVIGDECLSPDTLITMSDGNKKRIDEVMIGDVVKTYNEKTHIIEDKVVRTVFKNISENENMYEITLSNGNIINITGNHKVLLTNGEWKRADDLEISDIINSIE